LFLVLAAAVFPRAASPAVAVGQAVPEFSITTMEGQRVDIADLRGKRVLLFMWASW
jgi:peroxiredoxin